MADIKNDFATDLVAYYELEESSGVRVDSHGSFDLNDTNTVGQATGKIGNCADFEAGNSEGLQTGSDFTELSGINTISVSLWFNLESNQTGFRFICGVNNGGTETWALFKVSNTWYWRIFKDVTGTGQAAEFNQSLIGTGTWRHFVGTYDGARLRAYIDGSLVVTGAATSGNVNSGAPAPLSLGHRPDNTDGYYDGLIDEVGLWERVLTSSEVTDIYNSGVGIPYEAASGGGAAQTARRGVVMMM